MILVDANIFLEILLEQDAKEKCKEFLNKNITNLCLSDFSLHSIGLILFKQKKESIFSAFVNDIVTNINITSLSKNRYERIESVSKASGLDFDDAYQFCIGEENKFEIATQDADFKKVKDKISIHFI